MLTSSDPLEFVQWYLHEYYPQVVSNPFIPDNLTDLEKRLNEVILYWYIARYCLPNKLPFTEDQSTQIREYMEANAETALPVAVKAIVCENSDNWIDNLGMDYVGLAHRLIHDVPEQIFGVFGQIPERLMPEIWDIVQWIETRRGNMLGVQKASLEGRRSITELHEKYIYPLARHGKIFKNAGKHKKGHEGPLRVAIERIAKARPDILKKWRGFRALLGIFRTDAEKGKDNLMLKLRNAGEIKSL